MLFLLSVRMSAASSQFHVDGPAACTFTITTENVMSPAEEEAYEGGLEQSITKRGASQRRSQDFIDQQIKRLRQSLSQSRKKSSTSLTMMFAGDQLVISRIVPGKENPGPLDPGKQKIISLLDKDRTYLIGMNGMQISFTDGREFRNFPLLPSPGIGLGPASFVDEPKESASGSMQAIPAGFLPCMIVSGLGGEGQRQPQIPGYYKTEMANRTQRITEAVASRVPNFPIERWAFSSYELFRGKWIARDTSWTQYVQIPGKGATPRLHRLIHLDSITSHLPEGAFELRTYAMKGASISIPDGHGHFIAVTYDPEVSWNKLMDRAHKSRGGVLSPSGTPTLSNMLGVAVPASVTAIGTVPIVKSRSQVRRWGAS